MLYLVYFQLCFTSGVKEKDGLFCLFALQMYKCFVNSVSQWLIVTSSLISVVTFVIKGKAKDFVKM